MRISTNLVHLKRRSLISFLLFSFAVSLAVAQQRTVTGTVSSATEGPLVGVNVVVQGTTTGMATDINGNYSITVPGPQAVLVFSYIG